MMKPAFLFDGRGILNKEEIDDIGFDLYSIGK
jgi:UDPglucose 6-dehydrogenase